MENPEIHLIYDTSYPGCLEKTVLSFIFGTCVTSFKKTHKSKSDQEQILPVLPLLFIMFIIFDLHGVWWNTC